MVSCHHTIFPSRMLDFAGRMGISTASPPHFYFLLSRSSYHSGELCYRLFVILQCSPMRSRVAFSGEFCLVEGMTLRKEL